MSEWAWETRAALERELADAGATISDLLDQCARLRMRCRVIDTDADWYAWRLDEAVKRAETSERERDFAERYWRERSEAYAARARLWKRAAKKYRRAAGHFAMRSDKHVEERDAALKFVAEAADKLAESALLERKLQAVIHAAESVGWNGVDNSKHLTQFIIDLAESAKQQYGVWPYADELKKAKKKIKKLKKKLAHERELCTMHATAASRLEREVREMRECEDDSED